MRIAAFLQRDIGPRSLDCQACFGKKFFVSFACLRDSFYVARFEGSLVAAWIDDGRGDD